MKEFELEPDEQIIAEVRRHWFFFALEMLPYAILAILPFALIAVPSFIEPLQPYAARVSFGNAFIHTALAIWLLFVWTGAWGAFTRYFLNLWILTNERLVEIEQRAFFNREVSSLLLNRVQDVTIETRGILPSLLNIGSITVQSAGAVNEFRMRWIPNPKRMRDLIFKYVPEGKAGGV